MSEIELRAVTKRYGALAAVDKVSLRAKDGELVSLLGPSGCGKTTTLNMIAGFAEPDEGEILIAARPVQGEPPHLRNLGMVFQNFALFPHLTVFENIAFGLRMRKLPAPEIDARTHEALALVELSGMEGRYAKQLSGGQCQRVALARAIVIKPAVLLLDEPFSALDASLRVQLRGDVRRIQKSVGMTTVFVTHDQAEAMEMSDRIVVMNRGRVEQVGTPIDVYEKPDSRFVASFLGHANLLPGVVEQVSDGIACFRWGDTVLRATGAPTASGSTSALVVRPERMSLDPVSDQTNRIRGVVETVTFAGPNTLYQVRCGDARIRVDAQNSGRSAVRAPGQDVEVGFSPDSARIVHE
jgi:putative spermidine/putrescine transport system ATP-binding protein